MIADWRADIGKIRVKNKVTSVDILKVTVYLVIYVNHYIYNKVKFLINWY